MKRKMIFWGLFIVFLLAVLAGAFAFHSSGGQTAQTREFDALAARFPIMRIDLPGSPFEVRDVWQGGTISVENADAGQDFYGVRARVRGRGNSTWRSGPEKRPLRIRFDAVQPMFGSVYAARDWVLLADRFDRSLMRNYSALYLARSLGGVFSIETLQRVHLFVNGEYAGVYLLTDERNTEAGRLHICFDADPARSGFFIELDSRASREGVQGVDYVNARLLYRVRYPGTAGRTPAHMEYAQNYLMTVSTAIRARDFSKITALIDLPSFVDFFIVQELYRCPDSGSNSIFMYIYGEDEARRLYMGPLWDFDLTAGNMGHPPEGIFAAKYNYWFRYLLDTPEFFDAVRLRWEEIRPSEIEQMLAHVRRTADEYRRDFEFEFARFPTPPTPLYLCQNLHSINYFCGQVAWLLEWLDTRIAWLDKYFAGEFPDYCHMQNYIERALTPPDIRVTYLGELLDFATSPILLHNVMNIELFEMAQIFGLEISFRGGEITMRRGDVEIIHYLDTSSFAVNGEIVMSHAPSIEINSVINIPLRVVAESLGYNVEWDRVNFYVNITREN